MSTHLADPRATTALTSKIGARHLDRLAVVYVRQSTMQQLQHHQESTRLQYGLVERAIALGWTRERVLVIDDDLGSSGASAEGRPGFQRLVAEASLDHVGIILGVEMSRLARSCRDWHQLLEVCALFGTLISDMDGVYDPAQFNDRLLLGLKGTMSEAELHILKQRMHAGRDAKAARGELGRLLPIGYVRRPSGEVTKDPDEQARTIVETIFEQFEVRASLRGVLFYLVEHDLKMPVRVRSGPDKGELQWTRPNASTLHTMLYNPTYAGAYVWGRRLLDPRAKKPGRPGTGHRDTRPGAWPVCLRDRLPAYITWERYEANLKQLAQNRQVARGVVRKGASLLGGMIRCGRCGRRMATQYSDGHPRYNCAGTADAYAGELCQSLAAYCVDAEIEALLLRALEPAALEVSLAVAADIDAERARVETRWQQRLERAQYDVDRSRRQYNVVEPENRLVARGLERQLEEHLGAQVTLQEDHRRYQAERPVTLTTEERDAIRQLASDIPALWHAPTTTIEQRKTILRQLIEVVCVTVDGDSERVAMTVTWVGGHRTDAQIVRPVVRFSQLSYCEELMARVKALRHERCTHAQIAERLNTEGWRPAKRRSTFTPGMVINLLTHIEAPSDASTDLRRDEWTIDALAYELSMPSITLYAWLRRGWVKARNVSSDSVNGTWRVWADAREVERLRSLRTRPRTCWPRKPHATTA